MGAAGAGAGATEGVGKQRLEGQELERWEAKKQRRLGSWKDGPDWGHLSRVLGLSDRRPWPLPGRRRRRVRAH